MITVLAVLTDWSHHVLANGTTFSLLEYAILFSLIFIETGGIVTGFIPADTVVLAAAGIAGARHHPTEYLTLMFVFAVASVLGDSVNYWVGAFIVKQFSRISVIERRLNSNFVNQLANNLEPKRWLLLIVLGRFLPFIRTLVPLVAHRLGLGFRNYIRMALFASTCWSAAMVSLGYFAGHLHLPNGLALTGIIVALVVIVLGIRRPEFRRFILNLLTRNHHVRKDVDMTTKTERLAQWQAADLPTDLAQQLATYNTNETEDAFYQDLAFGTAGMRGLMGPGSNRMNIFTVQQVTESLARFIDEQGVSAQKRGVVVSFDSRHHSQDFAQIAAQVLSAHGIQVYLFSSLRPTPELSFAVRHLQAFAGIMITASHNPKEYNGYKVYGEDGGQMIPEAVAAVVAKRAKITDIFNIQKDEAAVHVQIIDDDLDNAYLKEMKTVSVDPALIRAEGSELKFVYSPLHGTGQYIGEKALQQAGFTNYTIVKEQAVLDGDFPTVTKPNPEDPAALALAIEYAKRNEADVVVATDPDADRMGAAFRLSDGQYQVLTGNQIAAVLVNYLLTAKQKNGQLPDNGAIVTSIVSSTFAAEVAKSFGVATVDVLTGFKYIAAMIDDFQKTGAHEFLFGFEESFGYLVKPFAHDKDAIQALVLFAEVAAYYKAKGQTFGDGLNALFEKYGHFAEKTISYEFPGSQGHEEMAAIMTAFRQEHPQTIANQLVITSQDFDSRTQTDRDGQTKPLPQPQANVLKYWLADGSWVALRPSGTEPKLKLYIGVVSNTAAESQAKLAKIADDLGSQIKKN